MILLPQRVILECHIKLLWQTIDSLEMPQSLLCTPLQTHTAIHSKLYQTQKANLIHSSPSLALCNTLCCFLSLLIVFLTCFIPCHSLSVILQHCFLISNSRSYIGQQCFGSMCCFFLSTDFEIFLTFVSFLFSPSSLTLFIYLSLILVWEGNP